MKSNKRLDILAIRITMILREFLKEFRPSTDRDNCENFVGSIALAEVFRL